MIRGLVRAACAVTVAGLMLAGPLTGQVRTSQAATLNNRVFATNMGLFDGGEQLLSNSATRQMLTAWHTPYIRMPFRSSLSDSVELAALNAIKTIGAAPLVIVHGAADATVATDDPHLLGLVAQVFGSSTVYVEYGNEEDLAGINDVTYTNSWNAIVPGLKAAHPTYKFIGPVNFQSNATYIAYFVAHASPKPDFVSWHEYVCNTTQAVSYCMQHIANWATHVANTNSAEIAATGRTWPFMITEWNMDPFNDSRYLDPAVIEPWTTSALQKLNTLVPSGLVAAFQYAVDSHSGGFELINYNNSLTPQGIAFKAALSGASPPAPPPPPKPAPVPTHAPSAAAASTSHPPTPSPAGSTSKTASTPPKAGGPTANPTVVANQSPGGAQANHLGVVLLVIGSVLGTGSLGAAAFRGWLRFRARR